MEKPNTIQEEIRTLEQVLAEKKRELSESGKEVKHEDLAKEVVKEYTTSSSAPAQSHQDIKDDNDSKQAAQKFAQEPHAKQIEELLKISAEKGILNAVKVARHLNNPHLLDDFHDRLVLEFFKPKK